MREWGRERLFPYICSTSGERTRTLVQLAALNAAVSAVAIALDIITSFRLNWFA